MSEIAKINVSHLSRTAYVYLRQSSSAQVEHNRESTERQYALVSKATALGWPAGRVAVIDEDLGTSGTGIVARKGFARLISEVALGNAGIVLGLEVSRLARNNSDWYRLLDLCGVTDTLIGDSDGIYHPALFNDRLVLGLKGTMSEAESHVLRARLIGGIRNKATRGELRKRLPVGFIWGEKAGEVLFHPDEAVRTAVRSVFDRFAELGSARRVWLWLRTEGLSFPKAKNDKGEVVWSAPSYVAIHYVLAHPVYAGAYVFGRTRHSIVLDASGLRKKRVRKLPQSEWGVLIHDHHQGYIDWTTYEANRARLSTNTRPKPHHAGGALREGNALLQGLAVCGTCGRKLRTHYTGRTSSPGYHCANRGIVDGRGVSCLFVGAMQIDQAVVRAVLEALQGDGIKAALDAAEQLETDHDGALAQWRLAVERAGYEAQRAERRYRAVDPDNRLVARGLELGWEKALRELDQAKNELAQREAHRPKALTSEERAALLALGSDLPAVWNAPSTEVRDKKELLRTVLEEVIITFQKEPNRQVHLVLRWRGGAISDIDIDLPRRFAPLRTDEDTVDLVRRLATHYPDGVIAAILNRQGRRSAYGQRFTTIVVSGIRRNWGIPVFNQPDAPPAGDLVNVAQAATRLGIAPSTIHRWINEGIIAGEQLTPGAPWQIRLTDCLLSFVEEEAPDDYRTMYQTMRQLNVSRQTVLQRVKRGEIKALHVQRGRRKGLRLKVLKAENDLFNQPAAAGV